MRIIGHRGACGYVPENSISSLTRAVELEANGVEFDVRLTRDRIPVLIHDETLDRTTEHAGRVDELTLSELQNLVGFDAVPTLEAALAAIEVALEVRRDEFLINVELKEFAAVEPTRNVLLDYFEGTGLDPELILITSFDHAALANYREISSDDVIQFEIGLLTKGHPSEDYWKLADELYACSANIDLDSVSPEFVAKARQKQLLVMVYTVNSRAKANRMRDMGVNAIFSDFPDRVVDDR